MISRVLDMEGLFLFASRVGIRATDAWCVSAYCRTQTSIQHLPGELWARGAPKHEKRDDRRKGRRKRADDEGVLD